jgi:hypothetical protein
MATSAVPERVHPGPLALELPRDALGTHAIERAATPIDELARGTPRDVCS